MPTPYDDMWEKLNLNLPAHEGLLAVWENFMATSILVRTKDSRAWNTWILSCPKWRPSPASRSPYGPGHRRPGHQGHCLDAGRQVAKFEMNDRCTAGTGKFLEFMAGTLQVPLEEFGDFSLQADKRLQINSMCTVFAESEATSLMARGEKASNIALGLHLAIAQRTLAMLCRVSDTPPFLFAGGVAHNACMRALLAENLPQPLIIPEEPDMVGTLGAALYAWQGCNRQTRLHG